MNTPVSRYALLHRLLALLFLGQATVDTIASVYTGWVVSLPAFTMILPVVLCEVSIGVIFFAQQTRWHLPFPPETPLLLRTSFRIATGVAFGNTLVHLVVLGLVQVLNADERLLLLSRVTVVTSALISMYFVLSMFLVPPSRDHPEANT